MVTKEYTLTYGTVKFVGYQKSSSSMFCDDPQMTLCNDESDDEVYIDLKSSDIDDLIEGLKLMKETIPNKEYPVELSSEAVVIEKNLKNGVCRICGCTDDNPCYNPMYGNCWWSDEEHTICSHCADKKISNDPDTKHCINY